MLADPRVRKLSFTGSTEVGRLLLAQAAQRVVKCSMELGGNAPFIVFADADLDAAIEGALIAKMRHNGEACTAANRFYVERAGRRRVHPPADAHAMGGAEDGQRPRSRRALGPLVDAATRAKVARLVDAAVGAGARVLHRRHACRAGAGFFYPPTVLDRVAPDSPILAEEIFGPVAPMVAVRRRPTR